MLVLDNIKVVLWDFDDTLCIHEFHGSDSDSEHLYNVDVLLHVRMLGTLVNLMFI